MISEHHGVLLPTVKVIASVSYGRQRACLAVGESASACDCATSFLIDRGINSEVINMGLGEAVGPEDFPACTIKDFNAIFIVALCKVDPCFV